MTEAWGRSYGRWVRGGFIGIYVPTLGRPSVLQRVVDNIKATTKLPHRIVFVTELHDHDSRAAAQATGAITLINEGDPSYSNSLQTAYENDDSPFFIGANDDFDFQPGWDTEATKVMAEPGVQVVGLNDGSPDCRFTTISLIDRAYIEVHSGVVDMHNRVNYPYKHNYVDTEFHGTACLRGVFKAAPLSRVHHKHPDFGHAVTDATYQKSGATAPEDAATFQSRRHLWER